MFKLLLLPFRILTFLVGGSARIVTSDRPDRSILGLFHLAALAAILFVAAFLAGLV
jgi:hypothetical protein